MRVNATLSQFQIERQDLFQRHRGLLFLGRGDCDGALSEDLLLGCFGRAMGLELVVGSVREVWDWLWGWLVDPISRSFAKQFPEFVSTANDGIPETIP